MDLRSGLNGATAMAGWRPGMEMVSTPERYTQDWKDSVDKTGEEWRAYCEAVACLRRYFRTRFEYGREEAKVEFDQYLEKINSIGKAGEQRTARVCRLQQDFRQIGLIEGSAIEQAVQREVHSDAADCL